MHVLRREEHISKSVPKIILNDTIYVFCKTAIRIMVISNHNSFRVLFDKIASVYFIGKIYILYIIFILCFIYILALEMVSPGNQHCVNCIGTLSFIGADFSFFLPTVKDKLPPSPPLLPLSCSSSLPSIPPFHSSPLPSSPLPFPSPPLLSSPLEADPLNTARWL